MQFIEIILILAFFVFIGMLIAAFAISNTEVGAKILDKVRPSTGKRFRLFHRQGSESVSPYHPPAAVQNSDPHEASLKNHDAPGWRMTLERSPITLKNLNWAVCFLAATYVASTEFWRVGFVVGDTSLKIYFALLAIISPTCFAVVWLRLTGTEWKHALRLFIWVAAAFGVISLILPYVGFFIKYFSGACC